MRPACGATGPPAHTAAATTYTSAATTVITATAQPSLTTRSAVASAQPALATYAASRLACAGIAFTCAAATLRPIAVYPAHGAGGRAPPAAAATGIATGITLTDSTAAKPTSASAATA